jgi:phosphoenolpyruvate-protein kinase (PTS system EI component)
MKTLPGIAASRGISIGPAFHFRRTGLRFERCTVKHPAAEWARFHAARIARKPRPNFRTRAQINHAQLPPG